MKFSWSWIRKKHLLWLFLLLWLLAALFRNAVAERDVARLKNQERCDFAPFLVESAIMYGYINDVADGKAISGVDPRLAGAGNLTAAEQMSLSIEYAGGWALRCYRLFAGTPPEYTQGSYERSPEESAFLRKLLAIHVSEVPAILFLLLVALRVPWPLAFVTALLNVVSPAALGRYTGQDLLKGAFALPFLTAALASYAQALRHDAHPKRTKLLLFFSSFLALASWDASQITLSLVAIWEILRRIVAGKPSWKRLRALTVIFCALVAVAVVVPYSRKHGLLFSPAVLCLYPAAMLLNAPWRWLTGGGKWSFLRSTGVVALLGVVAWGMGFLGGFHGNYEHFTSLIAAKIRFLNVKPLSPELLTFDQRYLWTPELHSATWKYTTMIFPAALWVLAALSLLLGLVWVFCRLRKIPTHYERYSREFIKYFFFCLCFGITYCFFARFRDLTALFLTLALALALALALDQVRFWRRRSSKRHHGHGGGVGKWHLLSLLLWGVLLWGVVAEYEQALRLKRAYPGTVRATAGLTRYLREYDLSGEMVVADMATSAMLRGYTQAGIVVQAKYELPEVRKTTREYFESFFLGDEADFADFCTRNHATLVVVHIPTVTTPVTEVNGYRYMAACHELPTDSAALLMTQNPERLTMFREIPFPPKYGELSRSYRIYRFISPAARSQARDLAQAARESAQNYDFATARFYVLSAYDLDPQSLDIYAAFVKIYRSVPPPLELPARLDAPAKTELEIEKNKK